MQQPTAADLLGQVVMQVDTASSKGRYGTYAILSSI